MNEPPRRPARRGGEPYAAMSLPTLVFAFLLIQPQDVLTSITIRIRLSARTASQEVKSKSVAFLASVIAAIATYASPPPKPCSYDADSTGSIIPTAPCNVYITDNDFDNRAIDHTTATSNPHLPNSSIQSGFGECVDRSHIHSYHEPHRIRLLRPSVIKPRSEAFQVSTSKLPR
jgi:hypothetical protein